MKSIYAAHRDTVWDFSQVGNLWLTTTKKLHCTATHRILSHLLNACCAMHTLQVKNIHYTMAKPWDMRHPCHKGYERLNSLWCPAYFILYTCFEQFSILQCPFSLHRAAQRPLVPHITCTPH